MTRLADTLILLPLLLSTPAMAKPLPPELIGRHSGAMGQEGQAAKDGALCFFENRAGLGGLEIEADGALVVSFAVGSEGFKKLAFKFRSYEIGATEAWHPLQDGENRYSASLFRYGSVFRILVRLHRMDGSVAAIQWICAEPRKAEHAGTQNR